jgi:hypothetical protein
VCEARLGNYTAEAPFDVAQDRLRTRSKEFLLKNSPISANSVLLRLRVFSSLRKFCVDSKLLESMSKCHVTTKRTKDTKASELFTFQLLTSCSSRPSW